MAGPTKTQITVLAAGVIISCIWVISQEHIQIAASIWQIRHRGLMTFAGYSIPVPTNWYVQQDKPDLQLLIKLASSRGPTDQRWHPRATITLTDEPPLRDIDKWTSLVASSFKSQGTDPTLRRLVSADGEIFTCVGGDILPKPLRSGDPTPVAWRCRSGGHLEILLTGSQQDMSQSWDILSRIRKLTR